MSTEIVRANAYTKTSPGTLTNTTSVWDNNTSTYAAQYSGVASENVGTISLPDGSHNWDSGILTVDWGGLCSGTTAAYEDAAITVQYSFDGGTTKYTAAYASNSVELSASLYHPTALAVSVTGSALTNQALIKVYFDCMGSPTDLKIGTTATANVYEVYATGTYTTTPTVTTQSTTSPTYGQSGWTITGTGFTGATDVKLGTTSIYSYCTVTNDTTITVSGTIAQGTSGTPAVTNSAGTGTGASTITVQTVSMGAVSPSTGNLVVGSGQTFTATVSGAATTTKTWSKASGTCTGSFSGAVFTPTTAGTLVVTATSDADGTKTASSGTLNVYAAPTVTSSTASPLYGATWTITGTNFTGATAVTLGGVSIFSACTVTNSTTITVAGTLAQGSSGTIVVTTPGGASSAGGSTTIQTVSVGSVSPAGTTNTVSGGSRTFSSSVSGASTSTISWSANLGSINSSTGVWSPGVTAGTATITAAATADGSKTNSTTATVYDAPVAASIVSSIGTTPSYGASGTVTPTFSAGTGKIGTTLGGSQLNSSVASGSVYSIPAVTASITYYLRVTNAAGATADTSVTIVPATVAIGAISPLTPTVVASGTQTFSATVTGAVNTTVNWTATGGTFSPTSTSSGANTTWTAPGTGGSCTITATAAAKGTTNTTTVATVTSGGGGSGNSSKKSACAS